MQTKYTEQCLIEIWHDVMKTLKNYIQAKWQTKQMEPVLCDILLDFLSNEKKHAIQKAQKTVMKRCRDEEYAQTAKRNADHVVLLCRSASRRATQLVIHSQRQIENEMLQLRQVETDLKYAEYNLQDATKTLLHLETTKEQYFQASNKKASSISN